MYMCKLTHATGNDLSGQRGQPNVSVSIAVVNYRGHFKADVVRRESAYYEYHAAVSVTGSLPKSIPRKTPGPGIYYVWCRV